MNPSPLTILNASAGSGKTYSLVKTYILLLLSDQENLSKFSEIIAMTFTNKAALEMKTRIIQQLDILSNPNEFGTKSKEYADLIAEELTTSSTEIHQRARIVLNAILHRYEEFHVMTIDKFNLRLIRSFSLDLDIPSDFEIILNEDLTIEQVVDNLLSQLGKNEELTQLILSYSRSKVEEDEKWNIRQSLIEFAKVLKSERNFEFVAKLTATEFSVEEYKELKREQNELNGKFIAECKNVFGLFLTYELKSDDLPGVRNSFNPIMRLAEYTSIPDTLFTDSFLANCEKEPSKGKNYPLELRQSLLQLNEKYEAVIEPYKIYSKYIQNYFNMALLKYISEALVKLRQDERMIRISEFNKMISELVVHDEAPFIYERLGNRYKHFMLDEFQDTSRLQWLNMTPLIHESLGSNNKNLIVGDPKQSIYRFKNGVAEQFVVLPKLYNPEKDPIVAARSEYFDNMGSVENLDFNWRSSATIVEFNNSVFEDFREKLPTEHRDFYKSVRQIPTSSLNGKVSISSRQVAKKPSAEETINYILKSIRECEEAGFERGEICILGQTNKECKIWAKALTQESFKVVSVDSLTVENEPKIAMLISYLRLRLNANSQNENKQFAEQFCRVKQLSIELYRSYFKTLIGKNNQEYSVFDSEKFYSEQFGGKLLFFFKYESLYDLVQQCLILFDFHELDNPYLHHFADMVHSFELNNGPDLKLFVSDFQSTKNGKAVQLPASKDALQLMTIHKSKGLEFPVVIIPNIDATISNAKGEFFIQSSKFLLHTNLSKNSAIKVVTEFSEMEVNQAMMDKVNLLYVAMTRPIERLYIFNYYRKSTLGSLFQQSFETIEGGEINGDDYELVIGSDIRSKTKEIETTDQFFVPKQSSDNLWFPDIALQDRDELITEPLLSDEQRFGNQFHLAISTIHFKDEIAQKLAALIQAGEVEAQFELDLKNSLIELFDSENYIELFDGAIRVLSEQGFIVSKSEQLRPDLIILKKDCTIVVDYKTGLPKQKDVKQVKLYQKVLTEVGYPAVKSYLFYTHNNDLQLIE